MANDQENRPQQGGNQPRQGEQNQVGAAGAPQNQERDQQQQDRADEQNRQGGSQQFGDNVNPGQQDQQEPGGSQDRNEQREFQNADRGGNDAAPDQGSGRN